MGDHRVVGIGVLLDVEILLHGALRIGEEWPLCSDGVPELVDVELVVGGDDREPRVGRLELGIGVGKMAQEAMLLRVIPTSRQVQHHHVGSLNLRKPALVTRMVG